MFPANYEQIKARAEKKLLEKKHFETEGEKSELLWVFEKRHVVRVPAKVKDYIIAAVDTANYEAFVFKIMCWKRDGWGEEDILRMTVEMNETGQEGREEDIWKTEK